MKLKKGPKIGLFVVAFLLVFFTGRCAYQNGWIPGIKPTASSVPKLGEIPKGIELAQSKAPKIPLPSSRPTRLGKAPVRVELWAWNAQMGEMFANGGPLTTAGSLMEKHGVVVQLTRQDDVPKMQADLVALAEDISKGNINSPAGTHFVQIMGDGGAQFVAALNPMLKKFGAKAVLVGSFGRSVGEDGFWGLPEWQDDPNKAKGGVVSGFLRDGDWNDAMKWAKDHGIHNNPDEHTYDPEALNWIASDDYKDAVVKVATGFSEDRPVVKNGVKTGETHHIDCKQDKCGIVTWTPGDVMLAKQIGGLVPLLTTRENDGQMPLAFIGVDKWCAANRETVVELLAAVFEGSDQVRLYPEALTQASVISAKVYGEEKPDYWERYYKGVTEKDKLGMLVPLGGSSVFNLADNLNLFGITSGYANTFEATYTVFGDVVVQQYPKLVPNYPKFSDFADMSYLQDVARKYASTSPEASDTPSYQKDAVISQQYGNRDYPINFKSGSAELTPDGVVTLKKLSQDLAISHMLVEIHGHTDNTGNSSGNVELSRRRAEAVKTYLERTYPATFPTGRIKPVVAHGDSQPVADNSTEAGKAKNRRVQIITGTN